MIEQYIQAMLRTNRGGLLTANICYRLQLDHNIYKQTYHIRAVLRNMERHGMVELVASPYKVQLKWRLPN